eukprot:357916-Chlamydomonas_euryale.AAC.1
MHPRYVWALVHSSKASHYELGRSLANAQRSSDASPRDYRYLEAVAMYKVLGWKCKGTAVGRRWGCSVGREVKEEGDAAWGEVCGK